MLPLDCDRAARRVPGGPARPGPPCGLPRGALAVLLGATLWLAGGPVAQAQQVLQWRQPDGTMAYSAMPPAAGAGATPSELRDADAKVVSARAALAQAEQAVRSGQQPLPGERQRLVNGHSRLTSTYFDRIAALEGAVSRARAALRMAQSQRAALAASG